MWTIGVDVGGTFTDVVLINEDGTLWDVQKVPSTTHDLSEGCQTGINALLARQGVSPSDVRYVVHGTTAPINALIQRRGAKTALVTTRGFRDVLEIARQTLPNRYDLRVRKPDSIVTRDLCLEITERTLADGSILIAADLAEVDRIADCLEEQGIEAVAIGLLNSYANDANEVAVEQRMRERLPHVYVSRSSAVANEFREYERFSTTVVNSYVGPATAKYFGAFQDRLETTGITAPLAIFQSNGGVNTLAGAQARPASLLMSGPAAGVIACAHLGHLTRRPNLITLDIGGTSCDVAVIVDGEPLQITSRTIEGIPIRSPMIDVHSIGAGGGSIAWIDQGGLLRVGPQSAGSQPGPASYDRGGTEATVSDANLVLGRLNPNAQLGGLVSLRQDLATQAIHDRLSGPLDMHVDDIACGILDVVNANMARAVRVMTVERGHDPRDFTLVAFGGAGPLHACDLADELGINQVLIPRTPGALCALGALLADFRFDFIQTKMMNVNADNSQELAAVFAQLDDTAIATLADIGTPRGELEEQRTLGMRYVGQNYELQIGVNGSAGRDVVAGALRQFHSEHQRLYGYSQPHAPVQGISYRLTLTIPSRNTALTSVFSPTQPVAGGDATRPIYFRALGGWHPTPVVQRATTTFTQHVSGPLLIEQDDTTVLLTPDWTVVEDEWGNLIASRTAA